MTRINTNVSSLLAQTSLQRSNVSLQESLTRLSTGLRINAGKDDPAGLIASELLRSDISAVQTAISNSERANQIIATADSALGQVSSLLNDIRGLIVEASNDGALSSEQIAANQLQVDTSLEALNRISQTTSFQGRRLLDGSLDFLTTGGTGFSTVTNLQIDQANLGATGEISVDVDISAAAEQASITNSSATATNAQATSTITFAAQAQLTGFDGDGTATLDIDGPGDTDGVTIEFTTDASLDSGDPTAVLDRDENTLTITVDDTTTTTLDDIAAAIEAALDTDGNATAFNTTVSAGDGTDVFDPTTADLTITDDLSADSIDITFATAGPDFNDVTVELALENGLGAGNPRANYDANTKTLLVTIDDTNATATADIATAIQGLDEVQTATATDSTTGVAAFDGDIDPTLTNDTSATSTTGSTGGGTISDDLVFELSGLNGGEVFQFESGTSISQIAAAVNLVSNAIGVSAEDDNGSLILTSTDYGSKAFVDVNVISEGNSGLFGDGLAESRATGADVQATVNGTTASADGNRLSINTSTLDLSLTVDEGSSTDIAFTITGGGALFQLGPDVVSNQQARLGITSVNTAKLGGVSGKLYDLASGGNASLENDPTLAAEIIEEAIIEVTTLRGRLGAFQRTTLDVNIATLNDALINLTDAESAIRDADFAAETARLTRSQILVQSGTAVLQIANSNPQNVLSLLR